MTLVHSHMTAAFDSLWRQASSLKAMAHGPTHGTLAELFLTDFLVRFLPEPIAAVSGIIADHTGFQSPQIDVILYDKRVMLPLIVSGRNAVCPIESVIAIVEVKAHLNTPHDMRQTSAAVQRIAGASCLVGQKLSVPLGAVFAYGLKPGQKLADYRAQGKGAVKMQRYCDNLLGVCVMGEFSWMKLRNGWALECGDSSEFAETKRFVAVLVDNVRSLAEARWQIINGAVSPNTAHWDIVGAYIRVK